MAIINATGTPSVDAGFTKPEVEASLCNFKLKLPKFSLSFVLPDITILLPKIPIPFFHFAISCDLSQPIDISAGLSSGGGRQANFVADPDDTP